MLNVRFSSFIASAVICVALLAGCSTEPATPTQVSVPLADTRASDETAIRAASAAWSQAATAKDVDKTVSFYGEGAVVMSPKAPAVRGSENIRKGWVELLATPGPGLSWQTTSVEVARSGDLAYETGTYVFSTIDKKGKTQEQKGKYVVVWKKQTDGAWKVAVDTDNTDD